MGKILVTGGNGFLGKNFIAEAIICGHSVICLDSSKYIYSDKVVSYIGDVKDREFVSSIFDIEGDSIDYVFHFAAIADIGESSERPYDTITTNILGTVNLLESIRKYPQIKRFFFASSMYVYNQHGSFYRASKQSCEILLREYQNKYKIDYSILRYGSLYGTGAQLWNGLTAMVHSALKYKTIEYNGTGKEIRDYINITDASRITLKCMSDEYVNKAIIITGTQTVTLDTVMEMISEILNNGVSINKNGIEGDHYKLTPYRFKPDSAIKIQINSYKDLGEGILEVIEEAYEKLEF